VDKSLALPALCKPDICYLRLRMQGTCRNWIFEFFRDALIFDQETPLVTMLGNDLEFETIVLPEHGAILFAVDVVLGMAGTRQCTDAPAGTGGCKLRKRRPSDKISFRFCQSTLKNNSTLLPSSLSRFSNERTGLAPRRTITVFTEIAVVYCYCFNQSINKICLTNFGKNF
jgi:hypothetical protein